MPKWLLIMFIVGSYIGGWIVTAWVLKRRDDAGEDPDGTWAALIGLVWPLVWGGLLIEAPILLVAYIVRQMK